METKSSEQQKTNVIDNCIRIECESIMDFFYKWFEYLQPQHSLTKRETDVMVLFLKYYFTLKTKIKDKELLCKTLFNEDTRKSIREELGISIQHFQTILTKLKKNDIIRDNEISPKFVPKINRSTDFKMMLYFDFSNGTKRNKSSSTTIKNS